MTVIKRSLSALLAFITVLSVLSVFAVSASAVEHRWGEWKIEVAATRKKEGKKVRVCLDCGEKQEEIIPKRSDPLTDIPDGKWYTAGVLYCYENGLMNGTSATTFSPDSVLTRAMFVTVLAAVDKADTSKYTGSSFSDVKTGKWYSKPIEWAYRNGYTSGVGNGVFGLNDPVTREQLAVFLCNYTEKKGKTIENLADISKYTDAKKISSWAKNAIRWAVGNNLISGTSDTLLSPRSTATRAQIALIIRNYVEKIVKKQDPGYELPFIPL